MLFRASVLLSAMLVMCASVVGGAIAAPSARAATSASGPSGETRPAATVEERVALFKARLEDWRPPQAPHRARTAQPTWRAPPPPARPAPAIEASRRPVSPLLEAAFVPGAGADSLATLRASGDQHCLATAIYYEARNQPLEGQEAVAQVVMNRVGKPQFSDSVCGVVAQGGERRGCQFSFVCDGSMNRPPRDALAWATAEDVAARTLRGAVAPSVGSATFYHADYVSPWWSRVLPRVTQIGAHIFYNGLDSAAPSFLRSVSSFGKPFAPPLIGDHVGRTFDGPLLPGGLLGGA